MQTTTRASPTAPRSAPTLDASPAYPTPMARYPCMCTAMAIGPALLLLESHRPVLLGHDLDLYYVYLKRKHIEDFALDCI